jgi:type I restriction enzyme, S subunit
MELPSGTTFPRGFGRETRFSWPLVRVGDLVELRYGRALVEKDRRPGRVPVYGTNGQCGWHSDALAPGPGVVIGRKGQGPLGVEWCEPGFWVIDTAYFVQRKHPGLDLRFFYYLTKYVGLNHLKDGTSNPTLSRDTFGAQLFPLPPLHDQHAIVSALSALDEKIELNRRMNETLESLAQTIFRSWFVDFDPVRAKSEKRQPVGVDAETAALFPSRLVQSQMGEVPEGWEAKPVRDLVAAVYDGPHATPPPSETGNVFLGIRNFTKTHLDLSDLKRIADADWPRWTKRVTPQGGDIVFTYEATLGFFALIPSWLRCCLGRRTALVRPVTEKRDGFFIFHQFISPPFQDFLRAHVNPGSTVDRILLSDFPGYPLLWPGLQLAQAFHGIVEPMWQRFFLNVSETLTLTELRDILLPKLISGELRVPAAEKMVEAAL